MPEICQIFEHRGTGLDDITVFEDGFAGKELHQSRWKAFLKKKKAMMDVSFEEVIDLLCALLMPIVQSMDTENKFIGRWSFDDKDWK